MRILVDTNRYTDFCKGMKDAVEVFREAEEINLPFAAVAELRAGFASGNRGAENERVLTQMLNKPRVSLLFPDEDTTRHYANLFRQLRTQGTPIPTHDVWIAALAVQFDLYLFSRDEHFRHLPQIPRI